MQNDKLVIQAGNGTTEVILREGAAPKVLDPKAPLSVNIAGTLGAVLEYLKKRDDRIAALESENAQLRMVIGGGDDAPENPAPEPAPEAPAEEKPKSEPAKKTSRGGRRK